MADTIKIEGQLEIDTVRGVIYFHDNATGTTKLRICSLPVPIRYNGDLLDITCGHVTTSYRATFKNWLEARREYEASNKLAKAHWNERNKGKSSLP